MRRTSFWGSLLALTTLACGTPAPAVVDAGSDAAAPPTDANTNDAFRPGRDAGPQFDLGTAARPAPVIIPSSFDGTTPMPLIILLHGDGVTGPVEEMYLHLGTAARASGVMLALPTGTRGSDGFLTWNDGVIGHTTANDIAYLGTVIDQAEAMLPLDTSRVYFVGHASGGFMAYVMACAEASRIAGIASIAAGEPQTFCAPSRPVSILDLNGTADTVIPYDGVAGSFFGAIEATQRWAGFASCDITMARSPASLDLDGAVPGAETMPTDYVVGCTGARVSLFTMTRSGHIPTFSDASAQVIVDWLLAQSSPP